MSIRVDPEFKALIPPLSPEEFKQLEENCVRDGIRDALVVWHAPDGDDILIDGHNRFEIAAKHGGMPFKIERLTFKNDRDGAKAWIIRNQLGRRNISEYVRFELLKQLEPEERKKARKRMSDGGKGKEILPDLKTQTRDVMGAMIGVSGKQYDKMKYIDQHAPDDIKEKARTGEKSVNEAYRETVNIVRPLTRPDPVGDARKEHEEFQKRKRESVVSMKEMQIDKLNQEIIGHRMLQDFIRMLNKVQDFGLTYKTEELQTFSNLIKDDERSIYIVQLQKCKGILQLIEDNIRRQG